MARASDDPDPVLVHRFALRELPVQSIPFPPLNGKIHDTKVLSQSVSQFAPLLEFQRISIPEVSLELKEITEGNWPFPRKVPLTKMTTGDVTLSQAVMETSSDFFIWLYQTVWGRGCPRRSFVINSLIGNDEGNIAVLTRHYVLYDCLPVSWKPGSDFDASAAEVSIEELTMHVERLDIGISKKTESTKKKLARF